MIYRTAAIDMGVDNLCAVTGNFGGRSFLIKGGALKSENRYYNKKLAEFRSEAERCNGKKQTRRIRKLTDKSIYCALAMESLATIRIIKANWD